MIKEAGFVYNPANRVEPRVQARPYADVHRDGFFVCFYMGDEGLRVYQFKYKKPKM